MNSTLPRPDRPVHRIAILTAPFGMGHQQAAQAVAEALPADWAVRLIDPFQFLPAQGSTHLVRAYLDLLRFAPQLWGMVYSATEVRATAALRSAVARGLWLLIGRRLQSELAAFAPDGVVAVHPFCAGLADTWIASTGWPGALVVVTTDFAPHPFWLYPSVAAYCVATPAFAQACRALGVPANRLHVTGIPLRSQFASLPSLAQARASLGLPTLGSVVLLMGGGLGLGRLADMAKQLLTQSSSLTVVVLAGRNHSLQRSLRGLAAEIDGQQPDDQASGRVDAPTGRQASNPSRLMIQGPVDNVAEWMAASDVLISKPGGLTIAEALAVGTPLILVDPLPGQEQANAHFLIQAGVAWQARQAEVSPLVQQLLAADPAQRGQWRARSLAWGRPQAARAVLAVLEVTLQMSQSHAPSAPAAATGWPTEPALVPSESSWSPPPGPVP